MTPAAVRHPRGAAAPAGPPAGWAENWVHYDEPARMELVWSRGEWAYGYSLIWRPRTRTLEFCGGVVAPDPGGPMGLCDAFEVAARVRRGAPAWTAADLRAMGAGGYQFFVAMAARLRYLAVADPRRRPNRGAPRPNPRGPRRSRR